MKIEWRRSDHGEWIADLDDGNDGQVFISPREGTGLYDADHATTIDENGDAKWTRIGTYGSEQRAKDAVRRWVGGR